MNKYSRMIDIVLATSGDDSRVVAVMKGPKGRVYLETPIDRAFGLDPSVRVTSHTAEEIAAWWAGTEYSLVAQCSFKRSKKQSNITLQRPC